MYYFKAVAAANDDINAIAWPLRCSAIWYAMTNGPVPSLTAPRNIINVEYEVEQVNSVYSVCLQRSSINKYSRPGKNLKPEIYQLVIKHAKLFFLS